MPIEGVSIIINKNEVDMIIFGLFVLLITCLETPGIAVFLISVVIVGLLYIYIKGNIDLKKNGYFKRTGEKPPFWLR